MPSSLESTSVSALTSFIKELENKEKLAPALWAIKIKYQLPHTTLTLLLHWLGCYNYILPAQRTRNRRLERVVFRYCGEDLVKAYYSLLLVEFELTDGQQIFLAEYLEKELSNHGI